MKTPLILLLSALLGPAQSEDSRPVPELPGAEPQTLAHALAARKATEAKAKDAIIALDAAEPARLPTAFARKLAQRWNEPHGNAMQTLLKEIREAEKSGDAETYRHLTETYTIWAEKYLVRDPQSANKPNP